MHKNLAVSFSLTPFSAGNLLLTLDDIKVSRDLRNWPITIKTIQDYPITLLALVLPISDDPRDLFESLNRGSYTYGRRSYLVHKRLIKLNLRSTKMQYNCNC